MIKQFEKKDIDIIMKIWKDNNQKFQSFISNEYWIENYINAKNEFLNSKIYVYTEAAKILAFIAINSNNEIINIQVLPEIQREGIGEILVEKLKKENSSLCAKVFEKNNNAVLFFKAIGFKKSDEENNEELNEKYYIMQWGEGEVTNTSFIYFDNSIKKEIIEEFDKLSKVHFYNINTTVSDLDSDNIFSINISSDIDKKDNKTYIRDYINVRNKLNGLMKKENVIIYFDCNDKYEYLYDVIKDIIKVRNNKLSIVMHKPFSIEGTKKQKNYEAIIHAFENYNFIDIDYEQIGNDTTITFKEAFDKRDEEMLKTICSL